MAIDKATFRQVAGSFASGVTVVTTGRDGVYRGLTASSFTSLSLEPPLILVCVDQTAQTLPLMHETGHFAVNILSADQRLLSQRFASRDAPEEKLNGVDYRIGCSGVPILEDAIAYFECQTAQEYEGGDHVIFVGAVIAGGLLKDRPPLVYFRGRYQ